jgi:hypothetical protein
VRKGSESIRQIQPADGKVSLFQFCLLYGALKENRMFLNAMCTWEKPFLVKG